MNSAHDCDYDILIKFTNYSEDMMNGQLYCNNIDYFRKADSEDGLGDQGEGTIGFSNRPSISVNNEMLSVDGLKLNGKDNFLFCMTALSPSWMNLENQKFKLSKEKIQKFKKFGTTDGVVITKPDDFIKRIEETCKKLRISCFHKLVDYRDRDFGDLETLHKEIDSKIPAPYVAPFLKPITYRWQREYRFLFFDVPQELVKGDHFVLDIGPLNRAYDANSDIPLAIQRRNIFRK